MRPTNELHKSKSVFLILALTLRGCDELMCMDITSCQSVQSVKYLTPIELRATSHCPGAIEAGCKYLHDQVLFVQSVQLLYNRFNIATKRAHQVYCHSE